MRALGRFLEVSVRAPDVVASLAFYESLGFVQAMTGDTWTYPYGVVTDGRLSIGLHQSRVTAPALTFVRPELARHAPALEALGVEFEFARLDEATFNQLGFLDPSGQMIVLVEARTFTPPPVPAAPSTALGYFEEFGIPTADLDASARFWERLGFVAFERRQQPFGAVVAASRDLNVGLYDLELPAPVLTFSAPDMVQRITRLRERGLPFRDRVPRGVRAAGGALLEAPEGTLLLLLTSED